MKYFIGTLFCALVIAGCIFQVQQQQKEKTPTLTEANVISIEVLGDNLVQFKGEAPIHIDQFKEELLQKVNGNKPVISISAPKDIAHGDLIDVQDILRETNMLRINYSMKSSS